MDLKQAKEIMSIVYDSFPNINRNQSETFNKTWLRAIVKGDYTKTLRKLEEYCMNNKYPPAIADFLVKDSVHRDDKMQQQIKAAEEKVKQEMADPVKAARREQLLSEMRRKLGVYYDD